MNDEIAVPLTKRELEIIHNALAEYYEYCRIYNPQHETQKLIDKINYACELCASLL